MTVARLSAPSLITRHEALKQLAETLSREPIIAVDTESNSLHAYREQVCLIQFSTAEKDFLVDPLALDDLSPLGPVFSSPAIEKVFHAAEYDLLCMKRDFGFRFANLFDTMVAARILGREAVGLGSMLEVEFGVHADKRNQRANWGQRPLPSHLLAYAQLDTHFLIPLRDRMLKELRDRSLWSLAIEDFTRMGEVNGRSAEERPGDCWRIAGVYDLTPQKAAVLQELCRYRDKVARSINQPLFKVIGDSTLLAIATECPASLDELRWVPGMSYRQVERHGKQLLATVQRGLKADPVEPPRSPRPSEQFLDRLEALRRWRKNTADTMGVKSDIILPRDLLFALAEQSPHDPDELKAVLKDVPWRLEKFGPQILQVLHKPDKF
jgi:ribonuclease D